MQNDRSDGVFNTSLTELTIILFFILLLFLSGRVIQAESKATDASRAAGEARAKLSQCDVRYERANEGLNRLISAVQADDTDDAFRRLREISAQERVVREAGIDEGLVKRLAERLSSAERALEESEQDRATLLGQYRRTAEACQNPGFGYPPCWVSEDGDIEYVFDVLIENDRVAIAPAYPPDRASQFQRLPNADALSRAQVMSTARFNEHTQGILDRSRTANPECRHYVRMYDISDDADDLKRSMILIESNFYKLQRLEAVPPVQLLSLL